ELAGAGPSRTVQPEFYVRGGTRGAEEILGASHVGTPVAMPENLSRSLPSQMLRSRIEALTQFTLGLERLIQRDSPAAVNWFQRAVTTPGWRNNEGKEVAYLLLGTALRARNQPGDLDLALQAYWTSADLNPQYARAHIGLGNVYYDQFA